jgi:hypothetical protein
MTLTGCVSSRLTAAGDTRPVQAQWVDLIDRWRPSLNSEITHYSCYKLLMLRPSESTGVKVRLCCHQMSRLASWDTHLFPLNASVASTDEGLLGAHPKEKPLGTICLASKYGAERPRLYVRAMKGSLHFITVQDCSSPYDMHINEGSWEWSWDGRRLRKNRLLQLPNELPQRGHTYSWGESPVCGYR